MNPRVERFEMRVDERLLSEIDAWRVTQPDEPSRAEAVRRLVELGLARPSGDAIRLTDGDKLLIVMLRDIYRHLGIENGEIEPDFLAKVIWGGHYWAPTWRMTGMFHGYEDNPQHLRFVVDVLDMWNFLERGYERLTDGDKDRVKAETQAYGDVTFAGFDGNNESSYMGIAAFLVEELDRFTRFQGRDLNAHMPTLETYGRMLSVFEPIRKDLVGRDLTADEIIAIMNERLHPSRR